jgi:hypothetical protein
MNFATTHSHRPHKGTLNALLRSTAPGLSTMEWDGGDAAVQLWWGPVVRVRAGDRVTYFAGATGIQLEAVDRATETL